MKKFLATHIAPYNKALVPLVVAAVLAGVAQFGVTEDMTISDAVTLLVTAGFVYLVPNKKA